MLLRVIIADDEPAARERLRQLLEAEPDLQIVAECADGLTALSAICDLAPDLAFLDIRMPLLNGFEVVQQLPPRQIPAIVFVSAHRGHALQAFEIPAVDYLLKPFDRTRFQQALRAGRDAAQRRAKASNHPPQHAGRPLRESPPKERLAVRSSGRIILLNCRDILWIKSAGNYLQIRAGQKTYLLRQTLASMARQLPSSFARISKTCIVNIQSIRELKPKSHGDCILTLHDGSKLTATRTYRHTLRDRTL